MLSIPFLYVCALNCPYRVQSGPYAGRDPQRSLPRAVGTPGAAPAGT